MTLQKYSLFLFLLAIAILIIVVLSSFFAQSPELIMLSEREITEYEGEPLSSILDFRENSIRGHSTLTGNPTGCKSGGL